MKTNHPLILGLVDPVHSGPKRFMPELERRKIDYWVIESGIVGGVREAAGESGRCIPAMPSVELMAEKLRGLGVTHVMGCIEPSLAYAEQLCAQMGLPSNGLRLSEVRLNKALMTETLRNAGIRVPRQFETAQLKDLLAWVHANGCPVVLKPLSSGGTDNVYLCHSITEVEENFHKVFQAKNLAGAINTSVLAQEYVDGIEYIVDCVSSAGAHSAIGLFEYQKGTHNGRAFIYEKFIFLKSDHPVHRRLREFAYRVLDELEVRNGASHMEVKINSRDEVVFIEVGARTGGTNVPRLTQCARADGKGPIQYVLDVIQGLPLPSDNYETARGVVLVCIISETEGCVQSFRNLESIQELRSFAFLELKVKPGQRVSKTIDLGSLVGWVELVHADPAILAEDEKRLDEILRQGILVLEMSGATSWDIHVATEAYRRGVADPSELIFLGGPSVADAELAQAGNQVALLLELICSLPARVFEDNLSLMAEAIGFGPEACEIFTAFHEPISAEVLSRADMVRTNGRWRLFELNIGSNVGGLFFASLPRLAGRTQERDVLKRWAELTVQKYKINGRTAIVEDSQNVEAIRKCLRVLAAEIESIVKFEVPVLGHQSLRNLDGLIYGPNGPVESIYKLFGDSDIVASPKSYEVIMNGIRRGKLSCPMGPVYSALGSKGTLALLWELCDSNTLTSTEVKLVEDLIPRTFWLSEETYSEVIANQRDLVLKPVDGARGVDVFCGREMEEGQWRERLDQIVTNGAPRSFVAQEYCEPEVGEVAIADCEQRIRNDKGRILWGIFVFGDSYLGTVVRTKPAGGTAIINQANGAAAGPLPPSNAHES